MKTQCLRSGQSAMSSTWSTMMATPRATTPPRASSVGSATGRTLRTDHSSFQRSSSSSPPSPWALSSDRGENTTISVSHDCFVHSTQSEGSLFKEKNKTVCLVLATMIKKTVGRVSHDSCLSVCRSAGSQLLSFKLVTLKVLTINFTVGFLRWLIIQWIQIKLVSTAWRWRWITTVAWTRWRLFRCPQGGVCPF